MERQASAHAYVPARFNSPSRVQIMWHDELVIFGKTPLQGHALRVLAIALANVFFQDSFDEWSGKTHSVTKRSPDAADRAKERRICTRPDSSW